MTTPSQPKPHWIVPTYHRMRAASFLYAFLFCALYASDSPRPPALWALLVLQFLVYPHLVYWRALRAAHPQKAELSNLLLDMALWGLWAAAAGYPPWITFTLFIPSAINNAISLGHRGLVRAVLAFAIGTAAGLAIFGFHVGPPESPWVALMCTLGLTGYLMGVGQIAYRRTLTLRRVREELRRSEAALQSANDHLRHQLAEIEALQQQLRDQANRDALTGLFNRRYLVATLERELARCRREGQPMALLMLDVDHFKAINDHHGHRAGDETLRRMGQLLASSTRKEDIPCRYGGEEFVLLMPGMSATAALERAEALCAAFSEVVVPSPGGEIRTTVSIGVAVFPEHGDDLDALTHHADQALYWVKRHGRNATRLYDPVCAQQSHPSHG
jgi:diguanylate cyclase